MEDFAQTYCGYSDDDLASLHGNIDTLTDEARLALLSEVQRRGLGDKVLSNLRDERTEHAARVKREWQESRSEDASRIAVRVAIRIGLVIAGVVIVALIALIKSTH
jgi:hypothetical protein